MQALPSVQTALLTTLTQPLAGLQLSVVQPLWSSQLMGKPPWQLPPEQESPAVQALPSLQPRLLLLCLQPADASQMSLVQAWPSSHWAALLQRARPLAWS